MLEELRLTMTSPPLPQDDIIHGYMGGSDDEALADTSDSDEAPADPDPRDDSDYDPDDPNPL
jgi:hypothetical protein